MLLSENRRVISPLSAMAMVFVAGIAAGFAIPAVAGAWGWLAGIVAWLALVCHGWSVPCPKAAFVFLAGCTLAMRTECRLAEVNDHAQLRPPGGGAPRWTLVVEGGLNLRNSRRGDKAWVQFLSHAGPQPVKVTLPVAKGADMPKVGEVWECEGWLGTLKDEERRYRMRTLWVTEKCMARRIAAAEGWRAWRRIVRDLSGDFSRRIGIGLSWCPEVAALNGAMLLGNRNGISAKFRNSFIVSGTIHVFAVSGLHVMLIAHLMETILKALCVPLRLRSALVMVLAMGYVLVTGARPSAVRAALMAELYQSATLFGRRPDSLAAWSLAVFIVYGISPERFFDAGCALSFVVMFGVVIWIKWSLGFSYPEFLRRIMEHPCAVYLRRQMDGSGISVAAWVAGVPVAAHIFGRFTWGGLVANIFAVSLAGKVVALGLLGLAASYVSNVLAAFFNILAAVFTFTLLALAHLVAKLPDVSFPVDSWNMLECAAWYGVFVLMLIALERTLPRRNDLSGEWWT